MRRSVGQTRRGWAIVLTLIVSSVGIERTSVATAAESWQAGVSKVIITPKIPLWMAGYAARNRPADGKLTELWAKALWLEDVQDNPSVLITLDLIGLDRGLSQVICQRLEEHYGLQRHQIALCASHTHSGPVVGHNLWPMHYELLDEQQRSWTDEYADSLVQRIDDLVRQARDTRQPVRVKWGNGRTDFAVNRRSNREPDVPQRRSAGTLQGPTDHDVPILALRTENDELLAVVFGYACHATVLDGYQWCGDYPGYAQQAVEEAHPNAVAMFWAGCGADQNPIPRRKTELAQQYGRQLADSVLATLQQSMQDVTSHLRCEYAEIDLPLDTLPTRAELEQQAADANPYVAARASRILADWDTGRPPSATYPYPVAVWQLGDEITWAFLGGEVVVDYALILKDGDPRVWVAGYSNDVMAYIPSLRVLREGGYEGRDAMVYYGLPTAWSTSVEQRICEELTRQRELVGGRVARNRAN